MEQATAIPETVAPPDTIEYGGLIWKKDEDRSSGLEYITAQPECGRFRIYQYPEESSCDGRWLWSVDFETLLDDAHKPAILVLTASKVVGSDIKEAMQACLDAKDKFIADIKMITVQLGIGNYPTGYMDGQAALVEKIRMVLP